MSRKPKVVYSLKSYRVIEAGGTDKAGNYRGVNIEKKSKGDWKMLKFRADPDEARQMVEDVVLRGRSLG